VFPTQLARTGLEPALRSCLSRSGLGATLQVTPDAAGQRFSSRVEAAVYFCCSETVHGLSERSSVSLAVDGATLLLQITGMNVERMDLLAIRDRIAAVDGSLTTDADGMTVVIPVASSEVVAAVAGGPGS
jgi:hypothetical protein